MISLRTLGPLEVTVDGGEAPRELMWRKNLALLLYLARSPDRRRTREHLVGLFWGDKPDTAARHSLNESLRVIRKSAGEDLLLSIGDQVALSPEAVQSDVDDLEALLHAERWGDAVPLMRGPFLEGFAVPDSSVFEDWLAGERMAWLDRMGTGLRRYAEDRLAAGDGPAAQAAAARALSLDPFSDGAVRLAMLGAAVRGERAGALAIYDAYAERLFEELGMEPDPQTETLAGRIRSEREWRLPGETGDPDRWARRVPLAGRESELQAVQACVAEAFSGGSAALVVVQGDSGAGKTRLAEEVAARARLEGAVVAHIRCVPGDRDVPWSGLSGLCHGGLLDGSGAAKAPPAALAFALTNLSDPDERLAGLADLAEPAEPARAVASLVKAVGSSQPVLLWIDGAGHLDPESASVLPSLLRDASGVPCVLLLTGASYPVRDELDDLRARIGRDVAGVALTLGPLDAGGLADLVRHVLPDLDDDALGRITRRIEADSAGLPLLAIELLTAVRLGLELEDVGGVWPRPFQTMEQTYPGDLPDSIVAAIRVGYRRLSRPAQAVLAAASVLDDRCEADLLSQATGLEGDPLFDALDELEWHRWLVAEQRGYAFVARIVRDVVARDMLTPGQRRRIQEAVSGA
ncbi:MAG: AAA family ATPase [Gemmatimonadetes bacterium]|nr:AAA family ATPase [Gemmatimonadota bacterium]